jgi:hypothetical protein
MARSDGDGFGFRVAAPDRVTATREYGQNRRNRQDRGHEQPHQNGDHEDSDREAGGGKDGERRRHHANPNRSTLFDLLFEEVDATPGIDELAKRRLKDNVRRSFRRRTRDPTPSTAPPTDAPHPPTAADDLVHVVVPAEHTADTERLIRLASESVEDELHENEQQIREARMVASQLRQCLSQHTETALKVSSYLRALLVLTHGNYKPKLVIEV